MQQQIRSCSAAVQPELNTICEDDIKFKYTEVPAAARETKSQQIDHENDVGQLFKVGENESNPHFFRKIKRNLEMAFQKSDLYVRLATPSQLQPKPDADALSFGKLFTDHMLKIFWHKNLGGWQKPEITPMENLTIHPAAKVLHYAVEVNIQIDLVFFWKDLKVIF